MSNRDTIRDLVLALQMLEDMKNDFDGFVQGLVDQGYAEGGNSSISISCSIMSTASWFWCSRNS